METKTSCTCTRVRHTAQVLTELYDRTIAPSGLKITQYILLRNIQKSETGTCITKLAQEVDLDRSTIGRNLRVLERDGFIAPLAGDDRREHKVFITEKGHQAIACAYPLWQQAEKALADSLGPDHLNTLQALLSHLEQVTI